MEAAQKIIPRTIKAIETIENCIKKKEYNTAYSLLLGLTHLLYEESGKMSIVIFDEFPRLSTFKIKRAFSVFGNKIMVQKETMYIISSSQVSETKRILHEELSLLFGNFEVIELKPFDYRTSSEFLSERLEGIKIEGGIKKFLIALTNGHPFYLDVIASRIREITGPSTRRKVDKDTLISVLSSILFDSKGILNQYFSNFLNHHLQSSTRETAISILHSLVNNNNKLKHIATTANRHSWDISKQIFRLQELDIISKNGVFYNFTNKLFRFWLKYVYWRKESSLDIDTDEKLKVFAGDVEDVIYDFLIESGKDARQRARELLRVFRNEIVEIDNKSFRLPQFEEIKTISCNGNSYLIAHKNGKCWAWGVNENEVCENEVTEFIRNLKTFKYKIHKKVLITLRGMEVNATLLAKENKIWIWDLNSLNLLLDSYGKSPLIN